LRILAGAKPHLRVRAFSRQQLHRGARRACDLRALSGQHLDAMDRGADRDVAHRQAVARANRRFRARHQLRAHRHTARRNDVTALAVGVAQEREMRAAVRIVFEPLDLRRNAILVAAEIDDPVVVLVAATLVPRGDVAEVVATRAALLRLREPVDRTPLVQVVIDDLDDRAATRRRRFDFLEGHLISPPRN
jgi:hypothetical protein